MTEMAVAAVSLPVDAPLTHVVPSSETLQVPSGQHPLSFVAPHHCTVVTKDLEFIQQAVATSNDDQEEPFINYLSKSQRKKLNRAYQTHSKLPLFNSPQWRFCTRI